MEDSIIRLVNDYQIYHGSKAEYVVSCGGRFEILGNHTDHNHGLCLASACDLEIIAAIAKREDNIVCLKSVGFPQNEVDISNLEKNELEFANSDGLIRGIAAYLVSKGYQVGGFNAYSSSSIFKGAGVSSSAAFELLVGHIFNLLFNEEKIPLLTLCRAGQYAENEYFGKKSGLLDQIGVAYGGVVSINFKDIENPVINKIDYPFDDLHFVLINTGGDHSSLSALYSQIPQDMYDAANEMKERYLADCEEYRLDEVKEDLTEDQYLRAKHFFSENRRVLEAIKALSDKNKEKFLRLINESRVSSTNNLKNMMVGSNYKGSPLEACDLVMKLCEDKGAVKINGGGFAGSVISVIPTEYLDKILTETRKKYGSENVKEIFIRNDGPITLYKL